MNFYNKKWFTIIELLVVITVLSILGAIWFTSYISYISSSRDSSRLSQIIMINKGFQLYTKWLLPLPDNKATIYANWSIIWYQWYVWENILLELWVNEWWRDPLDNSYYTYLIDTKQKNIQLLTFLEDENDLWVSYNTLFNQANANDYTERFPLAYGSKLWILVESWTNTPIQENSILLTSWLDVVTTTNYYKAYLDTDKFISWTWLVLQKIQQSINYEWVWFSAPRDCPEGFIKVPWNIDFNQPGFCVMKYEATYEDATVPTSNRWWSLNWNTMHYIERKVPVSKAWLYPIADVSQSWAIESCKSMWAGYHLITNNEWMTIARNIESVWSNWSWKSTGSWYIYNWVSNTSMWCTWATTKAVYTLLTRDFWTTTWWWFWNALCDSKRQLTLSNSEIIWDLSGNVREHVNWANTLNSVWNDFATMPWNICWWDSIYYSFAWNDWVLECNFVSPYSYAKFWPKTANLNAYNGIWRLYSKSSLSIRVFLRWAGWDGTMVNGIYALYLGWWEINAGRHVGFRCAK
jgi:type II secretory pathway pseudopilin PulG